MAKRSASRRALPDRVSLWLATHLRNVGGALLIGLAAVFAAWATLGSLPLSDLRRSVIESLGGGVYLVAVAVALAGALLGVDRARKRVRSDRRLLLRCAGGALALLALWGVAGAISLEQSLGGVSLSPYGAGGRVGGWLDSPIGWLVIVVALGVAFVLIAPGTTRRLARKARQAIEDGFKRLGREVREKGPLALASLARGLWLGFVWFLDRLRLMLFWIGREVWEAIRTIRSSDQGDRDDASSPRSLAQNPTSLQPAGDQSPASEHLPAQSKEAWPPLSEEPTEAAQTEQPQLPTAASEPPSLLRTLDRTAADGWRLPPINLLDEDPALTLRSGAEQQAAIIIRTLASFGVDAKVTQINEGPAITQFGVEPGWEVKTRQVAVRDASGAATVDEHGQPVTQTEEVSRTRVRVNRITRLADDLALALAAPSIRIEAPVPGQPIVGVEVPNPDRRIVALRGLIESDEFAAMASKDGLPIALGRDVRGNPVIADLTRMPHVLIAGATGSGKSVCINTIISSLLMQMSPEEVRLILVDPKRVELTNYGRAPHLAFSHVVTEPDEVVSVLGVVVAEMERRYRQLEEHHARNIIAFNQLEHISRRMPYWVVVLDELADMMMAAAADVEGQLVRLAQLARAVGIHLVVATQRPSVDVVTGLI
ncbi:MAG: DNA translocase FtsK, partial [Chloroflexi bacterium]|nr:DNA translocase FtsK [Chloroflexota bacterium]